MKKTCNKMNKNIGKKKKDNGKNQQTSLVQQREYQKEKIKKNKKGNLKKNVKNMQIKVKSKCLQTTLMYIFFTIFFIIILSLKMQSIRLKKQNQRKQIRRQFLDNHFKQLRRKHFGFGVTKMENQNGYGLQNTDNLLILLNQSLTFNRIPSLIRNNNLIQELNHYAQSALNTKNLLQSKFVLTIISNAFKDELELDEQEQLFRISYQVFLGLGISYIDFTKDEEYKNFLNVMEIVRVDVLIYYMMGANYIVRNLTEQDQINIQKYMYPAFMNILFSFLDCPQDIVSLQGLMEDTSKFILDIFDLDLQNYEMANRLKAKRNVQFWLQFVQNHYEFVKKNQQFPREYITVQRRILWLYEKLTQYFDEIKELFDSKQMYEILEKLLLSRLFNQYSQQQQKMGEVKLIINEQKRQISYILSILRTYIDKEMFINQITSLIVEKNQVQSNIQNKTILQMLLSEVQNNSKLASNVIQFLQGIMIYFDEYKGFFQIIENYDYRILQTCTRFIHNYQQYFLLQQNKRKQLNRILGIIMLLMNKQTNMAQQNKLVINFAQNQGMKKLAQIQLWVVALDASEDQQLYSIDHTIQLILQKQLLFAVHLQ